MSMALLKCLTFVTILAPYYHSFAEGVGNLRLQDQPTPNFHECFMQLEGGEGKSDLFFVPFNSTATWRNWRAFDPFQGAWLDTWIYPSWGVWNMGCLLCDPEHTDGTFQQIGVPNINCLNDGVKYMQGKFPTVTGHLWRLSEPAFTTCPLKRGKPVVADDSHLVLVSGGPFRNLRDCKLRAVQEQPTATAVIFEKSGAAGKACQAVVGESPSNDNWDASATNVLSCVFGCYGILASPYYNEQPSEVTQVSSAPGLTLEQCDRLVDSQDPTAQGSQIILPSSPDGSVVCNGVKTLNGLNPRPDGKTDVRNPVCFSTRIWHSSSATTTTTTTTATISTTTGTFLSTTSPSDPPTGTSTTTTTVTTTTVTTTVTTTSIATTAAASSSRVMVIVIVSGTGGLIAIAAGGALLWRRRQRRMSEVEEDDDWAAQAGPLAPMRFS